MIAAALCALSLLAQPEPTLMREYVSTPDPSFAFEETTYEGLPAIELTSQTWQGIPWKHQLIVVEPEQLDVTDATFLFITGDGPDKRTMDALRLVSAAAGARIAVLFDIPNQPLWERKEDALIAYTFQKYLESGDPTWPLLFPMVKGAVAAMDALEEAYGYDRFIVGGASKRGWTTWLTGAMQDPRVIGLIPMVIDTLNMPAQMVKQKADWGEFSPQIADYSEAGFTEMMDDPAVSALIGEVDPYWQRDRIQVPVLIVNGANDPYWTVDALSVYWDELPMPKSAIIVPNAGHGIEDYAYWIPTVAEFIRRTARGQAMPEVSASLKLEGKRASFDISFSEPGAARLWRAASANRNFHESEWREFAFLRGLDEVSAFIDIDRLSDHAFLATVDFEGEDGIFRLSAPAMVAPRQPR